MKDDTPNIIFARLELELSFNKRKALGEFQITDLEFETIAKIWDEISNGVKESVLIIFPEIAAMLLLKKMRQDRLKVYGKDFRVIATSDDIMGSFGGIGKRRAEEILRFWLGNPRKDLREIHEKVFGGE